MFISFVSHSRMAFGVDIGSHITFLMNLFWKFWSSLMLLSVIPIHDAALCSRLGIIIASYNLKAVVDVPSPAIIEDSEICIISSHLLIRLAVLLLIVSAILPHIHSHVCSLLDIILFGFFLLFHLPLLLGLKLFLVQFCF